MESDTTPVLSRLLHASSIDDHDEILRTADASLKQLPNDIQLSHRKVVALLKLDRFDDALQVIAGGGSRLGELCAAEKAYALYKSGQFGEAAQTLQLARPDVSGAISHLNAQVAYRSERFKDAHMIYERLASTASHGSSLESELAINRAATSAQLAWRGQGGVETTLPDHVDTFELAYNAACTCIARGRLSEASTLLDRATWLCHDSELSDAEKQVEMLPIYIQQGYVNSALGITDRALEFFARTVASLGGNDAEATTLKEINCSLLSPQNENPFILSRKVNEILDRLNTGTVFSHQKSKAVNMKLVLDMMAQKFSGVEARTKETAAKQWGCPGQLSVINAAAHARDMSEKAFMLACHRLRRKRPLDLGLALSVVQLRLREGKVAAAAAALESFLHRIEAKEDSHYRAIRFSPGLVAIVVSIYRLQGRQQSLKTELAKATEYYTLQSGCPPPLSLMREAGLELVRSPDGDDAQLARTAFESVLKMAPGDPIATAGHVVCYSRHPSNTSRDGLANNVPEAHVLASGLDAETLLTGGVASGRPRVIQTKAKVVAHHEARVQKKRRRRLPKDMDPAARPDPERWLPLCDRSSYRPKGKKGKKNACEATQGGMVKDQELLLLAGGAGAVKVEKAANISSKKKKSKGRK